MTSTSLTNHGDTIAKDYGHGMSAITIRTTLHRDGISLHVTCGPNRSSILSRTFPTTDLTSARVFYAHIRDAANAGKAVHQIEAEIAALIDATMAVDTVELVASLAADWDTAHAARVAAYEAEQAAVTEALDGSTGWDRFAARRTNTKAPLTGKAGELNTCQLRALALAEKSGEVRVQAGVAARTLESLERKGFGRVVRGGVRRYEVVKLVLNAAGLKAAGVTA